MNDSALSYAIVFVTSPSDLFVTLPVALILLTSPSTNPSPVTVTVVAVNGVPSYAFDFVSDVNVTLRAVIVTVASSFNV